MEILENIICTPLASAISLETFACEGEATRRRKTKNSFCYCCGTRRFLSDHHLKPRSEGGTDHPDNLVTVCSDCHDEVEGPADGAWERVVRHKADIKAGRIAKTRQERLNEKRECEAREREFEKARADRKRKALDAMGMIADENPMPPSLSELEAKRRSQGYLDAIDGRRYWSLAFGEERARLLFDAPLDEYVQFIVKRARGCAS